ncbi:MAG: carbon starvation protein A, partial [Treponema sp.]|nr:carbon starvation protein A [Treponema sp.]
INENDTSKKNIFWQIFSSKAASSICTLLPAYLLAVMGYQSIWTLFGAANQLLAALTLIACTMFFKKSGRRIFMLIIPTTIMLAVTYSSLVLNIMNKLRLFAAGAFNPNVDGIQLGIAVLLLILGILVAVSCAKKLLEKTQSEIELKTESE